MIDVITNFRSMIFDLCGRMSWPVYRYLPGNSEELPCYVVGRPDVAEGPSSRAMAELTVPVYTLGRTLRDDDAQRELDHAADELLNLFWTVRTEGVSLRATRVEASVLSIASVEVPAYSTSVVGAATFCP